MRFVARARFILIPAVAAVVVGAFFLKDGVPVNYIKMFDNPDQEKIEAVFGLENQTVVLYDKNTPDEPSAASSRRWRPAKTCAAWRITPTPSACR